MAAPTPIFVHQPTGVENEQSLARGIERAFASASRIYLHQPLWLHCETRWVPDGTPAAIEAFRGDFEPTNRLFGFFAGSIAKNELIVPFDNRQEGLVTEAMLGQKPLAVAFRFLLGRGAAEFPPLKNGPRPGEAATSRFQLIRPVEKCVLFWPFTHSE